MERLLEVARLRVSFPSESGPVSPVEDVSFDVHAGEIIGLVGESGCGKSLGALALMGLAGPTATVSGSARYGGIDLVTARQKELERLRGRDIAMIFQDPLSTLNPIMTIGAQIAEALHLGAERRQSSQQIQKTCVSLLSEVGLPQPAARLRAYPHELSGGMRQRAMIAMMLAREPALLIADEPTTALDPTVQAQILALLKRLRQQRGAAILLITHDFGVVAQTCDRIAVMYAGRIIETAPVEDIFFRPRHPYTAGLLRARASLGGGERPLEPIPGIVPPPGGRPKGCSFEPRCALARPECRLSAPLLTGDAHKFACHAPLPARSSRPAEPARSLTWSVA